MVATDRDERRRSAARRAEARWRARRRRWRRPSRAAARPNTPAMARERRPTYQCGRRRQRGERNSCSDAAGLPEFDQRVASDQIVDGRRVHIDAGDRVPRELGRLAGGAASAQRAARAPSGAVAKRFEVSLRSSASSRVPTNTTLPPKWRRKKSVSPFVGAGTQVGERICRYVVGAALKLRVIVFGTAAGIR